MSATPRGRICEAIAGLSSTCTLRDVQKVLDPLFEECRLQDVDEGITPLVFACDRGIAACLEYLRRKRLEDAWLSDCIGGPLFKTAGELNTPFHHAAIAGLIEAISILGDMGASLIEIASARNSHGDTPLMMASTAGQLGFCMTWHDACTSDRNVSRRDICQVWELQNASGDSCLSLACGHGQVDVVDFLLSPNCGVTISSDVIVQCQTLYDLMAIVLRSNPSLSQSRKDQIENVKVCLDKIQAKAAAVAEAAARELIEANDDPLSFPHESSKSKRSKKGKGKHKKQILQTAVPGTRIIDDVSAPQPGNSARRDEASHRSQVELTTLPDGTKAIRVEGSTLTEGKPMLSLVRDQRDAAALFKDRFQQGKISSEVDSSMQALCLDMSMLLYTPHQMAIDLSPSQLDVIQEILEKQVKSVHNAREIQERLHRLSGNERPP